MTERQTVAGAYAKIEAHEDLCAERYRNIHEAIADMKSLLRWVLGGVASVVIAITGWLAVQVYHGATQLPERAAVVQAR